MKAQVVRDLDLLGSDSKLAKTILDAPNDPSDYLATYHSPKSIDEALLRRADSHLGVKKAKQNG